MEPPSFSIQTRSRGLLQDDPADSSQSTPSLSQTAHHRQDGQYVLPTTPEQMEEIILARIAQVTSDSARSRSPTSFYDARQNLGDDLNRDVNSFHRQSTPKEVLQCYAPIPSHKTNDPDLWNCGTEWVHSTTLLRPLFTYFSLSSLVGSKVRVLVQDLYGHNSVCVIPNPLAKTWESNSGSQSMYATGLPTQPYKVCHWSTHSTI